MAMQRQGVEQICDGGAKHRNAMARRDGALAAKAQLCARREGIALERIGIGMQSYGRARHGPHGSAAAKPRQSAANLRFAMAKFGVDRKAKRWPCLDLTTQRDCDAKPCDGLGLRRTATASRCEDCKGKAENCVATA